MRRSVAGFAVLALLVPFALPVLAAGDGETPAKNPAQSSPARVEKTFLIPSSDGYGVGECLTSPGSECGQVVANAWCEAQGFAAANSYGVAAAEEYTGAVDLPVSKPADRPIRITCGD